VQSFWSESLKREHSERRAWRRALIPKGVASGEGRHGYWQALAASARLAATLISAYLPLIVALIVHPILEPGNPFFFISMLAAIVGFYIPGWVESKAMVHPSSTG
jgi:hypothetical protein